MSLLEHRPDPCATADEAIARAAHVREFRRRMFERPTPKPKIVDISAELLITEPEPEPAPVWPEPKFVDPIAARKFAVALDAIEISVLEYAVNNPQEIQRIICDSFRDWRECREKAMHSFPLMQIVRDVARAFGQRPDEIVSARRQGHLIPARHVAYALCKRLTNRSLPEIGRRIGHRDHSTILHGARKMEPLISLIEERIEPDAPPSRWAELAFELYPVVFGKAA